ncbi:hypothetical protein Rs2_34301 [Raphanus sativus]|nr:hypothetical protein Rs2_34301 [Raphanus sativus]
MRKSLHIVSLQPIAVYIRNLISLSLSTLKQESFLSIFSAVSLHFLGSSLLQNRRDSHRRTMENNSADGAVARSRDQLYYSTRSVMQQRRQDMVNREALCCTRLHEATLEAEALRLENTELRSLNLLLKKEIDQLIRSSLRNRYNRAPLRTLGGNNENRSPPAAAAGDRNRRDDDDVSDESPTNEDVNRSSLPKSISVRSSGYSKASVGGGGGGFVVQSRGAIPKPGTCAQQRITTTV